MLAVLIIAGIVGFALWIRRPKTIGWTGYIKLSLHWLSKPTAAKLIALAIIVVAAVAILPLFPAEFALIASIDWAIYAEVLIAVAAVVSRVGWRRTAAYFADAWHWVTNRIGIKRHARRAIRLRRQRTRNKPGTDDHPAAALAV
jgi:hypothetical protein